MSRKPGGAYPMSLRKKAVRRCLEGETEASVCREMQISTGALHNWKRDLQAEVAKEMTAGAALTHKLPEEAPPPEEKAKEIRSHRKRVPLGARSLLTFPGGAREKYVYRGVVEDDRRVGRVADFQRAGWEVVPKGEGQLGEGGFLDAPEAPGSTVSRASGFGAITYLMRKLREEEDADLREMVEKPAARLEEAIYVELDKGNRFGKITLGNRTEERKRE